jgi:hypothetical protein
MWLTVPRVQDLLARIDTLEDEMRWQHGLQGQPALFWLTTHYRRMRNVAFRASFGANLLLFVAYPWTPGTWVHLPLGVPLPASFLAAAVTALDVVAAGASLGQLVGCVGPQAPATRAPPR